MLKLAPEIVTFRIKAPVTGPYAVVRYVLTSAGCATIDAQANAITDCGEVTFEMNLSTALSRTYTLRIYGVEGSNFIPISSPIPVQIDAAACGYDCPPADLPDVNADTLGGELPAYYLDRENHTGEQAISTVTGLQAALDAANEVFEFANLAAFPVTGAAGTLYIAADTGLVYRWTGSAYSGVGGSLSLGETSTTAYRGDRGKTAYDHSQATGNPHGTTAAQVPNTPAGGIAATNVQDALNELDTEKAPTAHTHTASQVTDFSAAALAATAAAYAAIAHTHEASEITDFDLAADDRVSAGLALHVGAADPHTQYQLESEKGSANGYAGLDSGGKVPIGQLPSSIMEYKGVWNAATNTPTLANGVGDNGDVYNTSVAGTVNFGAGAITFQIGDWVIYNGTIWEKSPNSDAVQAVFGRQGNVVAATGDYNAGQITNTPAGSIAATDVQAAINELDTEKAAVSHTHVAADVTDFNSAALAATAGAYSPVGHTHVAANITDFEAAARNALIPLIIALG